MIDISAAVGDADDDVDDVDDELNSQKNITSFGSECTVHSMDNCSNNSNSNVIVLSVEQIGESFLDDVFHSFCLFFKNENKNATN